MITVTVEVERECKEPLSKTPRDGYLVNFNGHVVWVPKSNFNVCIKEDNND
jgi:hypothetical protein